VRPAALLVDIAVRAGLLPGGWGGVPGALEGPPAAAGAVTPLDPNNNRSSGVVEGSGGRHARGARFDGKQEAEDVRALLDSLDQFGMEGARKPDQQAREGAL
jgi:hypothetical protein